MPRCTVSLDNFDRVTDTDLLYYYFGMNKTTCSSKPFPTILLIYMQLYLFYNTLLLLLLVRLITLISQIAE